MTTDRNDLLARMEQTAGQRRQPRVQIHRSQGTTARTRSVATSEDKRTVDQPLHFEIYGPDHPEVLADKRPADDEIVRQLKTEINTALISRRDLYAFIGPDDHGGLFKNENQAYNLEYGLRQRPTITMECVNRWLAVLGKELITVIQNIEEGWFGKLLELQIQMAEYARQIQAGETPDIDWTALVPVIQAATPDENSFQ